MANVDMPMADWDQVLMILRDLHGNGYYVHSLIQQIEQQIVQQES